MATSGMVIAEATLDSFWGVGVAPNLAQETRRDKFLGQNHLWKESYFSVYFLMQKSILYAKIAKSQQKKISKFSFKYYIGLLFS